MISRCWSRIKGWIIRIFGNKSTRVPIVVLDIAIVLVIISIFFEDRSVNSIDYLDAIFILLIVYLLLILGYLFNSEMKTNLKEAEEKEKEAYYDRMKREMAYGNGEETAVSVGAYTVNISSGGEINALGRMMINLEDIKEFYTWSQKQAKASFAFAVGMCIAGFSLLVVAVVMTVIRNEDFLLSIIPTIGGVVSELLSGTSLVVYRKSIAQMNYYHMALHEDERFLSSVNLLSKFENNSIKDSMLQEIIRSEIAMNMMGYDKTEKDKEN